MSQVFSRDSVVHAASGSVGSMIAMATFYPLDQLRTWQQTQTLPNKSDRGSIIQNLRQFAEKFGIAGLYKGIIPVLISIGTSNFVFFLAYRGMMLAISKRKVNGKIGGTTSLENLLISTVAGIINVLLTTPLWVANIRMKMRLKEISNVEHNSKDGSESDGSNGDDNEIDQSSLKKGKKNNQKSKQNHERNLFEEMNKIAKDEGISALWQGTMASLVLVSNPIIQFFSYESLKRFLKNQKQIQSHSASMDSNQLPISAFEAFMIGAISKAIATFATYPLQVAQSRLRIKDARKDGNRVEYNGTIDCIMKIVTEEGFSGLFKGIETKVVHTVLTAAFLLMIYEKLVQIINFLIPSNQIKRV